MPTGHSNGFGEAVDERAESHDTGGEDRISPFQERFSSSSPWIEKRPRGWEKP
jgi:hypothetical protein